MGKTTEPPRRPAGSPPSSPQPRGSDLHGFRARGSQREGAGEGWLLYFPYNSGPACEPPAPRHLGTADTRR